jgi:hypothetical protein
MIIFIISCGKKGDPTLKSFEKPQAVKEITVLHREDELIISWSYSSVEKEKINGFYVEKAVVDGMNAISTKPEFNNISFIKSNESSFVDRDFKEGNKYFYKVRALSLRNVFSDDSPVFEAVISVLPKPPSGIKYKVMTDSVEIRWNPSSIENGAIYNLYKSFEKGKYGRIPMNPAPITGYFYTDKPQTDRPVYYTVRALRNTPVKDEGFPSDELEIKPSSFVPSRPAGLKFAPADGKIYLIWDDNKESWIKKYRIYKKANDAQAFSLAGESATPAFTDKVPLKTKTLYYITAVGPLVEGIASEAIEVNPLVER